MRADRYIALEPLDLNWSGAAKRLRKDTKDDFWHDPLRYDDLLAPSFLNQPDIRNRLADFYPRQATSWSIPKSGGDTRHSIQLPFLDRIVYQALTDKLINPLDSCLGTSVFSYRANVPHSPYMFKSDAGGWQALENTVRERIASNPSGYVVVGDYSRYFENIGLGPLSEQLDNLWSCPRI